ncbi:ABC transporter ATP-binding protein [Enterococcus moraviensis ATCC BAA-383]|uniref:ABC transporter ATP-binding protein n=1 Tax=Enterococcus moraviensis ATCC BAA-383 TaxID=1158609 RepID=R2T2E8_9ENTE|nr:Lsa family ABC-F type ribosomal protection protein [Enterococcus moraviensis]EOH99211.1 ABC transporter ATP-binding protein [Enterococcus moraviensis ATCC BAA-383]EOT72106.1 ABC transporter ATP-binding protein [Enterococcus moraviensis ATCC BAA-383]OJG67461.1 ABC transporter ATP-binding protein [Enterococcus moraviensis]
MSKIELKNITFGYDTQGTLLFDQANLNFDTQWKLGLIGRNGRGKTTLLNILQNKLAYNGQIIHQLDFLYFPQPIENKQQLTYYVLQEISEFEQWEIERELNLLQVDPEILWRDFETLSGGEQTKVLLALLFIDEYHFPLIDEPTNHLDIVGRKQVAEYLKKKRQGFIVVSHDRSFVDEVVDHVLSIEKSQLELYQGNFSVYEEQKKIKDEFELAQNEKLKKEVSRLKKTAAEKAEWSRSKEQDKYGKASEKGSGAIYDTGAIGARAARTMKRAKTIEHRMESQLSEKEALLKDIEYIDPLTMNYQPAHHKRLLAVENLVLGYAGQTLFQPISFEVNQGQRIALAGRNGSGKSSIIRFLLGQFDGESSGDVIRPTNLKISYVRQNYEDNHGTLLEFSEKKGLDHQAFLNNLHKLGMEREVFQNRIEQMSMGQRKKVELAKSLAQPAELYIWDEPLNYLDVFNQEQLKALILSVKPAMLLVEHDQVFLEEVASKVITLTEHE